MTVWYNHYSWGGVQLHVSSYTPPSSEVILTEISLIPDPSATPGSKTSVLQSGGRKRRRVTISGYCLEYTDLESLRNDSETFTPKVFIDTIGNNFTALIQSFESRRVNTWYEYDMTLVEV